MAFDVMERRAPKSFALPLVVAGVMLACASCSGGGGSGGGQSVVPNPGTSTPATPQANVQVVIAWPSSYRAAAGRRHPSYISASTASVSIAVNGGTALVVNNPVLTGSPSKQTTVSVPAPVGNDTFVVSDYASTGGSGALLAANTVPFDVIVDTANTLALTLNGNLNTIVCEPVAPFVTGTGTAFTQVGPTGQLVLLPEDAGANIIVAPGAIPQLTLAATTASQGTVTTTSTQNQFDVNLLVTGVAVALTASGTDLAGDKVSNTSCSDTRVEALYVANHGGNGLSPSVTIYPATASGNATPTATLAGPKTEEAQIQFPAVDAQGNLYVTNQGPMPGSTTPFGPTSGYVTIYGPGTGQVGNAAPIATIPNLNTPEGITFDTKNNLYVTSIDRVQEYAPGLAGAAAAPTNTISGSKTDLYSCYGMWVDSAGLIYTACSDVVNVFAANATGNATPTLIELETSTSMSFGSDSWLSVATDSTGEIYLPAFNQQQDKIDGYAAGTSGSSLPTFNAVGFSQPFGIFVDAAGAFYVTNFGNDSVDVFASSTTLMGGAVTGTSITGADTGINFPYGVYVR